MIRFLLSLLSVIAWMIGPKVRGQDFEQRQRTRPYIIPLIALLLLLVAAVSADAHGGARVVFVPDGFGGARAVVVNDFGFRGPVIVHGSRGFNPHFNSFNQNGGRNRIGFRR